MVSPHHFLWAEGSWRDEVQAFATLTTLKRGRAGLLIKHDNKIVSPFVDARAREISSIRCCKCSLRYESKKQSFQ
ncbi:hypothetical protein METHPM2_1210009 [Pseudomonas sp. PM2]